MTKQTHTAGPWHVHPGSPSIVRDEDGAFVAEGCSNADARLIAAAPAMLEALEAHAAHFTSAPISDHPEAVQQRKIYALIAAAIAQAKGES